MKKLIIILLGAVLAVQGIQAQGTIYLSSLSQTTTGSNPVGSDSWLAAEIHTGNNASGYVLDSIQLAMTDASGNPSGFTTMLYGSGFDLAIGPIPGSSLGTLNGSANPATSGVFTYTPASSITLSPSAYYFVVVTAGTTIASGAYESSYTDTSIYHHGDAWVLSISSRSNNGSTWNSIPGTFFSQLAITATPVPEPGVLTLLSLGGLGFLWHRRKTKAV